jgi:hypothetical protein
VTTPEEEQGLDVLGEIPENWTPDTAGDGGEETTGS